MRVAQGRTLNSPHSFTYLEGITLGSPAGDCDRAGGQKEKKSSMYLTHLNFDLEIRWLKEKKETLRNDTHIFFHFKDVQQCQSSLMSRADLCGPWTDV